MAPAPTAHTETALTWLRSHIFWWFFRQNVRIDLLFRTRYHKMVFEWFFKKSIFSAAPAPGRRAAGGKKFFFQNVSPKVLIYSRKKTGAKNVFFTIFYVRLYPSGLIQPPPLSMNRVKTACLTDPENRHFWLRVDPGFQIIARVDPGFLRFMHRVPGQSLV